MLGGAGVDGAIHRAAGPDLLEECKKIESVNGVRCPTGEARITAAGNLQARYVIHTVGPKYRSEKNPKKLLESAYVNSLDLALKNDCCSIAFPAISCGVYGYPIWEAAYIALSTCNIEKYRSLDIYFYLYEKNIFDVWNSTLERFE